MDISAVAYDWLATGKPLLVTRPAEPRAQLPESGLVRELPLLDAADAGRAPEIIDAAVAAPRRRCTPHWCVATSATPRPGPACSASSTPARPIVEERDAALPRAGFGRPGTDVGAAGDEHRRHGRRRAAPVDRRRQLALIALVQVLVLACWFSASAVVPALRRDWDDPAFQATLLTVAVQLGFVVGAVTSAALNLADRFPAHRVVAASALVAAAATGLIALAVDGMPWAVTLRFVTGIALAGVYPVGMKLMTSWFDRGRGFALGVLIAALTLGSAMPQLVSSFASLPWRGVLATASVSAVVGAGVAWGSCGPGRWPGRRPRSRRGSCCRCSATGDRAWPTSATSATCGSSTRCGPGCPPTWRPASRHPRGWCPDAPWWG